MQGLVLMAALEAIRAMSASDFTCQFCQVNFKMSQDSPTDMLCTALSKTEKDTEGLLLLGFNEN